MDGLEFAQDAAVLRWLIKRLTKVYGKKLVKRLLAIHLESL